MKRPLTPQELRERKIEIIKIAEELKRREKRKKFFTYFPDKGPLRRSLYKPHTILFDAGKNCLERCIIAANRIGKSVVGAYETVCHATGLYPKWWTGKKYDCPTSIWVCGVTYQAIKEISQEILLGPLGAWGTGMLPGDSIKDIRKLQGSVPNAVESITLNHISGELSTITFKAYRQGRDIFQGTSRHFIWLDEECPMDVYSECVTRVMQLDKDTGEMGRLLLTFTPLMGLTEVVMNFMPGGKMPDGGLPGGILGGRIGESKFVVNATWEDAPHLTQKQKDLILEATPRYLRDARAKGIPQLGSGAIYPILDEDVWVDDFEIPPWMPKAYALDVGWNCTAAIWGAWSREDDIVYLYSCHKQGHAEPSTHVQAIKARGDWINGVIDPNSSGRSQMDGKRLIDSYSDLGLNLSYADNALETGIFEVWQRLVSGRLKIFKSLTPWFNEFRIYRRDENGKVARDQDDHLMDCTRYLVRTGLSVMTLPPYDEEEMYFDDYNDKPKKNRRVAIYGI